MKIITENLVSITDANQNFSKVAKKVEQYGDVVILKNNKPRYLVQNFNNNFNLTDDEKIEIVAKRILKAHKYAFEVLAKW